MAITKPKLQTESVKKDVDAYINSAPDAKASEEKQRKKTQISLVIDKDIISKVDEKAAERGISRAAIINLAIFKYLQSE